MGESVHIAAHLIHLQEPFAWETNCMIRCYHFDEKLGGGLRTTMREYLVGIFGTLAMYRCTL